MIEWQNFPTRVSGANLEQLLYVHPGTTEANDLTDGGEKFAAQAYIPVLERRKLSADELSEFSLPMHWPPSHNVCVFAIDKTVLKEMRKEEYVAASTNSEQYDSAGQKLWNLLCDSSALRSAGPVKWLGVSGRPSGLRTSTYDGNARCRVGLHVDSWDRLPLGLRHLSRIRISINLGIRNRSFLFSPHDIASIERALSQVEDADISGNQHIGSRFCQAFPNEPVFAIQVPPGWAYLAPTENLIHDGSSEPSPEYDKTVAWIGHIHHLGSF